MNVAMTKSPDVNEAIMAEIDEQLLARGWAIHPMLHRAFGCSAIRSYRNDVGTVIIVESEGDQVCVGASPHRTMTLTKVGELILDRPFHIQEYDSISLVACKVSDPAMDGNAIADAIEETVQTILNLKG
jgi:hypothetical protein